MTFGDRLRISAIDSQRFGVVVARGDLSSLEDIGPAETFCAAHGVELAMVRVPTEETAVVQALEGAGFVLTDTLLVFRRELFGRPIPRLRCTARMRALRPGEAEAVRVVAEQAFMGYRGHYHADPRLPTAACDELYADWAYRGCVDSAVADHVVVAELEGQVVGFGLVRRAEADAADGTLYGVAPAGRGRGIYPALVTSAMRWARRQGCRVFLESTQVTNRASQKVWARLGFEISESFYTLHRWSTAPGQHDSEE